MILGYLVLFLVFEYFFLAESRHLSQLGTSMSTPSTRGDNTESSKTKRVLVCGGVGTPQIISMFIPNTLANQYFSAMFYLSCSRLDILALIPLFACWKQVTMSHVLTT